MANNKHRLSKSHFMAGLNCERRLWMLVNRFRERRQPTPAEERRMRIGTEFGRHVTTLYPGGIEIETGHSDPQLALDQTVELLRGDAPALFGAAFLHHEVLVLVDVLKRDEDEPSVWHLIEVKSASNSAGNDKARAPKLKKHISDLAVQLHVLEGAGITVK